MATSGSSDWKRTRNNLLTAALRIVGAVASGETAGAEEISEANDALNEILKGLSADGLHLWKRNQISNALVTGKASYTIGPGGAINTTRPVEILHAFHRTIGSSSNTDRELQRVSLQEYQRLPNKDSANGTVLQYAFVPTTSNATIYVWQPESVANCEIHLTATLPIEDTDNVGDDIDIPQEWFTALKWLLVAEIGPEYEQELQTLTYWEQRAEREKQKVLGWDQEQASVFIVPPRNWGR